MKDFNFAGIMAHMVHEVELELDRAVGADEKAFGLDPEYLNADDVNEESVVFADIPIPNKDKLDFTPTVIIAFTFNNNYGYRVQIDLLINGLPMSSLIHAIDEAFFNKAKGFCKSFDNSPNLIVPDKKIILPE